MEGPHGRIIADAAKSALGPRGFHRKGRSRTWIADHDWWATVVEFQPSSWSKGCYLDVAAHWLWSDGDSISFDFGGRVAEHVEYRSDAQFTAAVTSLAQSAAHETQRLAQNFPSLGATADVLLNEERSSRDYGRGGWMAYNAGVAAGLVGRADDAAEMFTRVASGFAQPGSVLAIAAGRMAPLVHEPEQFRREVVCRIEHHRVALRLPPLPALPF